MNWEFLTDADYELHEREAEARDALEAEQQDSKEAEASGEQLNDY